MPSQNGRTATSSRTPPRSDRATPSRSASRMAGFEFTSTRNKRNHDRRAELRGIPRSPRGDGGRVVPRRPAARPRPRRLRGRTRLVPPLPRDPRGLRAARDEADRRGGGTHRGTVPRRVISPGLPCPMLAERRFSQVPGDFTGHPFLVNDPPRLLVPDPAAGSAAALSDRFVVFLDRDRLLRDVRDRDVGEVFAHPGQFLLCVPERREERLSGPAQEADVLPRVRLLVPLEELRDADLPFGIAGAGVQEDVPHGLARLDREAALLHLLQGRRGRRQDDVLREGARDALREDELVDRDRAVEDALRGPSQDVDGLRDALAELCGGRREAEFAEHRLLADIDELRGVVFAELDAAELELVVLEEAVAAVQRADPGRLAREEHDPLVAALELDREADGARDLLADLLDRICVRGGPQPDGIDDAVDDLVAMGFGDLHRADEDVPRVRVDRFVALDATESGIFVSLVSKRLADKRSICRDETVEVVFNFKAVNVWVSIWCVFDRDNRQEFENGLAMFQVLEFLRRCTIHINRCRRRHFPERNCSNWNQVSRPQFMSRSYFQFLRASEYEKSVI